MKKVRISISREFMDDLKSASGINSEIQLTNEAFSLLRWAIEEAKNGRVLSTTNLSGENPVLVELSSLNKALNINLP